MKNIIYTGIISCSLALSGCYSKGSDIPLRTQLAQKIMLDVRYYCPDEKQLEDDKCKLPVTELPADLDKMIRETDIGGVILFAENFQSIAQVTQLTYQLQQAARDSKAGVPLLISADQEGGRVSRLPRNQATTFSGAMAIGATYEEFGTRYATESAKITANELKAVGVNVNHAPTVDVNVNPDNPVINVRSFGEDPKMVAEMAKAQMSAMQQNGVIATLKHFPGHGDTAVDSHTGLPVVHHDLDEVKKVDLLPFQSAIDAGLAKMIMTAHIQYPELDKSTFKAKDGTVTIKPATMSKAILTDLLRVQMGFDGVVITDALDMAGISQFFDQTQAVIETFKAGADIALMPFYVRSPKDLNALNELLDALEAAVKSGELDADMIAQSAARVLKLKAELPVSNASLQQRLETAKVEVAKPESKALELALAKDSITQIYNDGGLPVAASKLHILMPDQAKCQAITDALTNLERKLTVTCASMLDTDTDNAEQQIAEADVFVATNITPQQSAVELGGLEDIAKILPLLKDKKGLDERVMAQMKFAKEQGKKVVFVSLRTPYEIPNYQHLADAALVTYAYNTYEDLQTQRQTGVTFKALAEVLLGKATPKGQSPVTLGGE